MGMNSTYQIERRLDSILLPNLGTTDTEGNKENYVAVVVRILDAGLSKAHFSSLSAQ